MKKNFIKDTKKPTTKTKGIAIQLSTDLYQKIQQEHTSTNKIISEALHQYYHTKDTSRNQTQDIPIQLYEEIYSTLHNNEITPLKKKSTFTKILI